MTPDQLREAWFSFFEERGHTRHPSSSLVPENDPTLLFAGAGMNQFKAMFVGKGNLPFTRAATIQKCFRQGDLENVGKTPRHLTFFEMMGHFSFGDYFKKEAIAWAWEFLLEVAKLPADRLWVSVFEDDDEAYEAWKSVGIPEERIARFDVKENFWPANAPEKGPNGPCGPCTEIFFDYGPEAEVGDGGPGAYDSGRFIEIWNSVFTQYERRGVNELDELPQKNIDCGAGFERVLMAMEDVRTPFATSLFRPIVQFIADLSGKTYDFDDNGGWPEGDDQNRMRRIAEHARAACMIIADGVKPSNEGRGYVLRRVMRRAIRDGIQLGLDDGFLEKMVEPVIDAMSGAYPHLKDGRASLAATIGGEEKRFRQTFNTGLRYLEDEITELGDAKELPGPAAFKLYDTYGFPLDLAEVMLEERGITVDVAGFELEMEMQRERARAGSKIQADIFAGGPVAELTAAKIAATTFLGYGEDGDGVRAEGAIVGLIGSDNALVDEANEGDDVTVVLDATPFYAESGGQVGDRGGIETDGGAIQVNDTQNVESYHLHQGHVTVGTIRTGDTVRAHVDASSRASIRRNHTATHLMHEALKRVLGDGVRQEGSLVDADRLRFDFSHPQGLTDDEVKQIEDMVNEWILLNDEVQTDVMDLAAAKASGATSLFGEKYDDVVRVLSIDSGSRELCGGTHCRRTGDIGSFRVTAETSIAAGVRRIEAVTGMAAVEAFERDRGVVHDLAGMLKTRPEEIHERVVALQDELKAMKKAAEKAQRDAGLKVAEELASDTPEIGGLRVRVSSLPGVDAKALKGVWDTLQKGGVDAALLVGESNGKAPLLAGVGPKGLKRGLNAQELLRAAAAVLGGGGGGRPNIAQGQGQDRAQIDEALAKAWAAVQTVLEA